jgi:hypothetical protein
MHSSSNGKLGLPDISDYEFRSFSSRFPERSVVSKGTCGAEVIDGRQLTLLISSHDDTKDRRETAAESCKIPVDTSIVTADKCI